MRRAYPQSMNTTQTEHEFAIIGINGGESVGVKPFPVAFHEYTDLDFSWAVCRWQLGGAPEAAGGIDGRHAPKSFSQARKREVKAAHAWRNHSDDLGAFGRLMVAYAEFQTAWILKMINSGDWARAGLSGRDLWRWALRAHLGYRAAYAWAEREDVNTALGIVRPMLLVRRARAAFIRAAVACHAVLSADQVAGLTLHGDA